MGTNPTKKFAAAHETLGHLERTIANELPQELSKLPEPSGSAAQGDGRKNAGHPKTRKCAVNGTTLHFTNDGQPTILAAPQDAIHPR